MALWDEVDEVRPSAAEASTGGMKLDLQNALVLIVGWGLMIAATFS